MKRIQIEALVLALLLALSLLAGCGQGASGGQKGAAQLPPETTRPEDQTGPRQQAEPPEAGREITDMAGRTMVVPGEIVSAFPTDPTAGIYLYTLVPDRLLGWNYELNDLEKSVILEEYHNLPNFGMGDAINYEAVLAAVPTIAFIVAAINEGTADTADRLADQLGIPVVVVSNDLMDAPAVYRFMGRLFGVEEQAEQLACYAEKTFSDIADLDIPDAEKVRVYYGNGEDSLETAPAGTSHGQIMEIVNAANVAGSELSDGGRAQISLEQLLAWDPDVIVVNGEPKAGISGSAAAEAILSDPDFSSLAAVQNGKVYGTPNAPFSWVDRPPGPNRIVGVRWLFGLLYPNACGYDVDTEVRTYFNLFYHVDLTDEQLAKLYAGTL